jgi:3-hydroxyisobutyrate dehydrogenase-like beta-hydroxyacid dehydrogenase
MHSIHFIGIGKIGLPMAIQLMGAGHALTVSDQSDERCRIAQQHGLLLAQDTRAAIEQADFVFSSLPNDAALSQVSALVSQSAKRGTIFIDTSTVSQHASAEAAEMLEACGLLYLRATVSGNIKMAEAAQLTVMASGPRDVYEKVLPLLKALGPNSFYLGETEQARLMKLVVNLMIAQTTAMLAEGLTLGRKGGLDWRDMWRVLAASAVASPILKAKSVQLSERDFTPTFSVLQMIKDLDLILGAGKEINAPLAQTTLTQQLMKTAVTQGYSQEDYAAIIKTVEWDAQLSVKFD